MKKDLFILTSILYYTWIYTSDTARELSIFKEDTATARIYKTGTYINSTIRDLNRNNDQEIITISQIIQDNFTGRPLNNFILPKPILAHYINANTPEHLQKTLEKSNISRVLQLEQDIPHPTLDLKTSTIIGVLIGSISIEDRSCQIKRLHASLASHQMHIKGIGLALLNDIIEIAKKHNIKTLTAKATLPAKPFFEKLQWHGDTIVNTYTQSNGDTIEVPQFCCSFDIH